MARANSPISLADRRGFSSRCDPSSLTIWRTCALAAGLLAVSHLDKSGILLCGSLLLLALALVLAVCPWPGERPPAVDLLTSDMRVLLARSQVVRLIFRFAGTILVVLLAGHDPARLWIGVAVGGVFCVWALRTLFGLLFIHHDVQRFSVWTTSATGVVLLAAGTRADSWLALLGLLCFGLALLRATTLQTEGGH